MITTEVSSKSPFELDEPEWEADNRVRCFICCLSVLFDYQKDDKVVNMKNFGDILPCTFDVDIDSNMMYTSVEDQIRVHPYQRYSIVYCRHEIHNDLV